MAAPQLPAVGSLLPDAGNDIEVTQRLEDWLAVTRQLPGAAVSTTLTLDGNTGGRAVATGARHRVDTFGAAAAGTMAKLGTTNLGLGRRVKLSVASSLRPVTLLHAGGGTEQFLLANAVPMVLASDTATVELELLADGWHEVDRWWGTQDGSFRDWIGVKTQATYDLASQAEAEAGALDTRMMSALKVRQALAAPGWLASRPVSLVAFPNNALLLYDGTALYRVAVSTVLGQAPTKFFDSGSRTILTAGFEELTHGLGVVPRLTKAWLVNAVSELGYAVGTQIDTPDVRTYANATVVAWESAMTGGGGSVPAIFVSGGASRITNANWRIRLCCWA